MGNDVFERSQEAIDKAKAVSASVDVWGNPVRKRNCDVLSAYDGCKGCPEQDKCEKNEGVKLGGKKEE